MTRGAPGTEITLVEPDLVRTSEGMSRMTRRQGVLLDFICSVLDGVRAEVSFVRWSTSRYADRLEAIGVLERRRDRALGVQHSQC